jgi:hypothetical protein
MCQPTLTLLSDSNKLCQLNTDLPNTYVAIANLNTLIQAYLNSTTTNLISNKMVPYAVLPYFGPLTNFSSTGAGLNLTSTTGENWTKVYLCNGNNFTPDLRGWGLVGAIAGVPGGPMSNVVNPGASPANPNYVLGTPYGANQITLGPTQIPPLTHTHATTVTIVDPGHNHTFSASNGGDGSGGGYPATGSAQEGGGSFGMQNNQTGLKGTGAGQNVTVTNLSTASSVLFGDWGLTTSFYGVKLAPGQSVHLGTLPGVLCALATTADTEISLLFNK